MSTHGTALRIRTATRGALLAGIGAACILAAGCGGPPDAQEVGGGEAGVPGGEEQARSGHDPCTLVSAQEMEAQLGPLAEPPFRVNSRRSPDPVGAGCFYRARDGRNVTIEADWESGEMVFRMLAGTGQDVSDLLAGYDASADTLEGRWDKAAAVFGRFIALVDTVSIEVDPLGSRIGLGGAARLASIAAGRLDAPLAYDGSRATRSRRPPPRPGGDPCRLVTRAEAEALMGPLLEDPRPSEDGAGCDFPTREEMFGYPVTHTLTVQWEDGYHALGVELAAAGMAQKAMAIHVDPETPELSANAAGEAEPWDERLTLLGGLVTVVKDDVLLQVASVLLGGEDKALALLRKACSRI